MTGECQRCNAQAPNHRCAVGSMPRQPLIETFKIPERVKNDHSRYTYHFDACQKCGARSAAHRCPVEGAR